jgi:tetratricopeptide (TPR) repeat protein
MACVSNTAENEIPVTTTSKEALALYNEGMTHFDKGNFTEAIKNFEQAVEEDPNFGMAYLHMSWSFAITGDWTKYRELLNKATQATGLSDEEQLIILCDKADIDGDLDKQKEITDKLTAMYPDNAMVLMLNGMYYSRKNEHEKATEWYKKATTQSPSFGNYFQLGWSYYQSENYKEALSNFQKLVAMAPANASVLSGLGMTFKQMGKLDEAVQNFDKALAIDPNLTWALSSQGDTYLLMDKPDKAKSNYQRLLESASDNNERWAAHARLASCYIQENQLEDAYGELSKASQVFEDAQDDSSLWVSYHRRGDYCILWGESKKAKQDYDTWIAMVEKSAQPAEYKNIRKADYYLNMVRLALMVNDVDKAKSIEQQLKTEKLTEHSAYHKIQGLIATAEGRCDDALAHFDSLPNNAGFTNALRKARAYACKGDTESAITAYQQALGNPSVDFIALMVKKQAQEGLDSLAKMTAK